MSFFEPPAPPDRTRQDIPEQPAPPQWLEAPRNELGAPVPLRLVLARTETVAIALVGATAFTTGVQLRLAMRRRPRPQPGENDLEFFDEDPFELPPFGHPLHRPRPGRELPPEILRFGVQFPDGGKATTVEGVFSWDHGLEEDEEHAPSGPILIQGGGGGGGGEWESEFWLWPLPQPGPVEFVVEWPAEGIPITRQAVDAGLFLEASAKSEVLWSDTGGSSASITIRSYGPLHALEPEPRDPNGDRD